MADLSVNLNDERSRIRDIIYGAAIGVAAAMLSTGNVEATVKVSDQLSVSINPSVTYRASVYSTSNSASPYSAAPTWTPAANSLILALVANSAASAPPDPTSVSAHGIALTKIPNTSIALSTTHKLTAWIGNAGASPSNVAAAATIGGTPTGAVIIEFELTDWDNTGAVLDALAGVGTSGGTATSGSTGVTLSAQNVYQQALVSFYVHLATESSTGQGGSWVQNASGTGSYATPSTGASGQSSSAAFSSPATASWATSSAWSSIILGILGPAAQNPVESFRVQDNIAVFMTPGPPLTSQTEIVNVDDGGGVNLVGLGNPVKITDGPIVAQLVSGAGDLSVTNISEELRVVDGPALRTLNPEEISLAESLKVSDGPALGLLEFTAQSTETFKVDDGGVVDLIGLGNPIKITDGPVIAALAGNDLTIGVINEQFKVADLLSLTIDPEQAVSTESLRVSDSVLAEIGIATSASESLKVVDTTAIFINPEETTPSESLKISDAPQLTLDPEQTTSSESLKIADSASVTLNPEETTPSESLKIVDTLNITINPEEAIPAESLKVVDNVSAAIIAAGGLAANLSESLKIVDIQVLTLNPEQGTPSESLKADDGGAVDLIGLGNPVKILDGPVIAALFDPSQLQASLTESLKVVDAVSRFLGDFAVSLTESLKVADSGEVEISKDETVKITDTVTASLGGALATTLSEDLKVVDTSLGLTLNPEITTLPESVKVADGPVVAVIIAAGTLTANLTEDVKVVDVSSQTINPEITTTTETVKVADQVSASLAVFDISATLSESLKVADSVTAVLQLGIAVSDENVKVVDTPTVALQLSADLSEGLSVVDGTPVGRLNPLQLLLTEPVKVVDVDPSITTGTTIAINATEVIKAVDTATVALDPEERTVSEAAKVTDTVVVALTPEVVSSQETLVITDTVQASLGTLLVSISEGVKISESLLLGGPPVIDVVGSYSTVIDIVGERL